MTGSRRKQIARVAVLGAACIIFFNFVSGDLDGVRISPAPLWLGLPFVLLLLAIACGPVLARRWWNRYYPAIALILGAAIVAHYVFVFDNVLRVFLSLYDYISFLSLIGSLYVVAGGIHFNLRGRATPLTNASFLAAGAVLSNVLGTTGASMLLIRPFLRSNRHRVRGYHVVFFIFVVSNIGGVLTPVADPPLFLGYLKGVPFFWVLANAWGLWALVVGMLMVVFYLVDTVHFRSMTQKAQAEVIPAEVGTFSGTHNVWFLAIIVASVFVRKPLMVREVIMWGAAMASFYTTKSEVHRKNEFSFAPIREVVILFAGIFATMIPLLDWLEKNPSALGISTPGQFFWTTGALSSVLDNAPSYLSFLSAAVGLHGGSIENMAHVRSMLGLVDAQTAGLSGALQSGATAGSWKFVQAVSLGAVFFGATTYIGNGPNFMVKSIAEQAGVKCPSFLEYIVKYSIPILMPIFVIVWLVAF